MGKIILHGITGSPPVRSVLLTLSALELPYEFRQVNLMVGENRTPEYLAKNPHGTVPTLEDNGLFLTDSHAINAYLVRKYGNDDALYPKDFLQQAIVDERLFYEATAVFYGALRNITVELFFLHVKEVPQAKIDNVEKVYATLEELLKKHNYTAGDHLTIADFNLVATVTSLTAFLAINPEKYPKVLAWIHRLEKLPYYKEANAGVAVFHGMVKSANFVIVP